MKPITACALTASILIGNASVATAQRDHEWVSTDVYREQVVNSFDQCMQEAVNRGARPTNGLYISCLPNSEDIRNVLSGGQSLTSMEACVSWSLASMGGAMSNELFGSLHEGTRCRTEGIETISLYEMLGRTMNSEIEPYGI